MIYLTNPNAFFGHFLFRFFRTAFDALTIVCFERLPLVNGLGVVRVAHVAAFAGSDATPIVELEKRKQTLTFVSIKVNT